MASYSVSCDHNSVTFSVTGLSVGNIVRTILRPTSTTYLLYSVDFEVTSTSLTVTIPDDLDSICGVNPTNTYYDNGCVAIDLDPETDYLCRVYLFEDADAVKAGTYTDLGADSFTTSAKPIVAGWDWTVSNGSATADQTYTAYRAMTELSNCWWLGHFHYKVWNDLVYKTNEVITDRGGTWNTTYGTLAGTLLSESDTEITSAKLNAVWWNLSQYVATGLTKMSAGDDLPGSYFVTLAEAINNAIWRS